MKRELIAGIALALAARGPWIASGWRHSLFGRVALEIVPSVLYERFVDSNGWSWRDVGQRALGSVIVEIPLSLSHH